VHYIGDGHNHSVTPAFGERPGVRPHEKLDKYLQNYNKSVTR
jgi:hypothetical protein